MRAKAEYVHPHYDLMNPRTWTDPRMNVVVTMTAPACQEIVEIQRRQCVKCGREQRAGFQ